MPHVCEPPFRCRGDCLRIRFLRTQPEKPIVRRRPFVWRNIEPVLIRIHADLQSRAGLRRARKTIIADRHFAAPFSLTG